MVTKAMKQWLGIFFLAFVMVGCGTTTKQETPPPEPEIVDEPVSTEVEEPVEPEIQAPLESVFYFDFDQSTLKSEARAALMAQAERLKSSSDNVRLEGHADERGTREYNMALGERRANAVRDFLVLQGVDSFRIETISYGEERPVAMGSDEYSWSQNRRVELK